MADELNALLKIVTEGIQTLESAYKREKVPFPSLSDSFHPIPLDDNASIVETRRLVVDAALHIAAAVGTPMETIQMLCTAIYTSAALGTAVDNNIPDIIKSAGLQVRAYPFLASKENQIFS